MLCWCRSGTSRENRIARAAPDRSADRAAAPAIVRASSRPDMLCAWAMPVPFFFPVRRPEAVVSLSKGRGQCKHVLAAHPASEFCKQQRTDFCLPHRMIPKSGVRFSDQIMRNKEGGGAPKGASNHGRAISGARQRAKQPRPAQFRAPFACFAGARSPSGAPPRHFADCSAHLRAALPGITGCKREDPPRRQCSEHLAGRS